MLKPSVRRIARPPLAQERLSTLPDGRLLYRLKSCWRDGTTHVVLTPLELVEKLAALIPPPRMNLVRYPCHPRVSRAAEHRVASEAPRTVLRSPNRAHSAATG